MWALRRQSENVIDRWDGYTYRRVLTVQKVPVEVEVVQTGTPETPRLYIKATGMKIPSGTDAFLASTLMRMLGTNRDLSNFYRFVEHQPKLNSLVKQFRGVKPPRFPTLSEIIELAASIAGKQVEPDELENWDNEAAVDRLGKLRGIGRWSAEYVLLRGLGRIDVFPADDVGARNRLRNWLDLPGVLNYEAVRHSISAWKAYGGLIYFQSVIERPGRGWLFVNTRAERKKR